MMRRLLALFVALFVLFAALPARAQAVEIKATVTPQTVEIGDTVRYTLEAMSSSEVPVREPLPGATTGFSLRMTSSGPRHAISIVNGVRTVSQGLSTTWVMTADKVGTFTLGPASVVVGGVKKAAPPVKVTVVPKGKAPKRPFNPFQGLLDFEDEQPAAPPAVPPDPRLALDAARAPIAFLHATVDKTRAVVGEQVTLTILLYEDPYAQQAQPRDIHEPTAADFIKKSLVADEQSTLNLGNAMVGDRQWIVKLVRKTALFPLKSGHLAIEPMSMTLPQARVGLRETERLFVDVTEPPLAGRPPGYTVGDVGNLSLSAVVTPRVVERGGAASVQLELRGTGSLAAQLAMPVAPGIEWLEPQVREKLGPAGNDRLGGTKTFSYVVRLQKEGPIDLGEVRLPYFDPEKNAYAVARASLGIIDVKKGAARDAGVDEEDKILEGLPKERRTLEGAHQEAFLTDRPIYWGLLFGSPAACALALGAQGLFRRVRDKRASASASPDRLAKDRRAEAEAALAGDDGKAAMGAIARAVEADVLARTGVNVRGAPGEVAVSELAEAGVSTEDAEAIVAVLRACEDARFSPDGVSQAAARATWDDAKKATSSLGGKAS